MLACLACMGATESKQGPAGEGLVTVHSNNPQKTVQEEALLLHLRALQSRVPDLQTSIERPSLEPVWRDLQAAKSLGDDASQLKEAVENLIVSHQHWHDETAAAITSNQAYIHRTIDQAEFKAGKALQNVRLQAQRLKLLEQQLAVVNGLPEQLQELCDRTAAMQATLEHMTNAVAPAPSDQLAVGCSTHAMVMAEPSRELFDIFDEDGNHIGT